MLQPHKRHVLQELNTLCPFDFSDLADLVTPEMIELFPNFRNAKS
jgi:hypothetical protein